MCKNHITKVRSRQAVKLPAVQPVVRLMALLAPLAVSKVNLPTDFSP